jgi:hypothetical protein
MVNPTMSAGLINFSQDGHLSERLSSVGNFPGPSHRYSIDEQKAKVLWNGCVSL